MNESTLEAIIVQALAQVECNHMKIFFETVSLNIVILIAF